MNHKKKATIVNYVSCLVMFSHLVMDFWCSHNLHKFTRGNFNY